MKNRKTRLKEKVSQRRNEQATRKLRGLQDQINDLLTRVAELEKGKP